MTTKAWWPEGLNSFEFYFRTVEDDPLEHERALNRVRRMIMDHRVVLTKDDETNQLTRSYVGYATARKKAVETLQEDTRLCATLNRMGSNYGRPTVANPRKSAEYREYTSEREREFFKSALKTDNTAALRVEIGDVCARVNETATRIYDPQTGKTLRDMMRTGELPSRLRSDDQQRIGESIAEICEGYLGAMGILSRRPETKEREALLRELAQAVGVCTFAYRKVM